MMYFLNEQIEFWENVCKYAKHSVRKKRAEKILAIYRQMKKDFEEELADFYEYQRLAIDQIDTVTKATL